MTAIVVSTAEETRFRVTKKPDKVAEVAEVTANVKTPNSKAWKNKKDNIEKSGSTEKTIAPDATVKAVNQNPQGSNNPAGKVNITNSQIYKAFVNGETIFHVSLIG